MEFVQKLTLKDIDTIINTAEKFCLKEQKKQKMSRAFDVVILLLCVALAAYCLMAGAAGFCVLFLLLGASFLVCCRFVGKETEKKMKSRYISAEYLITEPEKDYHILIAEKGVEISGSMLTYKDIAAAFLYDDCIALVDKHNKSAVIKCSFECRKEITDNIYKSRKPVYLLDSGSENARLALKQNRKQLRFSLAEIAMCLAVLCFLKGAGRQSISDLPNQKYTKYSYNPDENFAYQIRDTITDSHNVGRRLNIYCEYISGEYNTRINVCRNREKDTQYTEIYFFDKDKLLCMVSAGCPDEKGERKISYINGGTEIRINEDGSSLIMERPQPQDWPDEYMQMTNYSYFVRRFAYVSAHSASEDKVSFSLKNSDKPVPDVTYRFGKDYIKFTEKSGYNNRTGNIYFINTESADTDAVKRQFDKLYNDIDRYGKAQKADFDMRYSIVENFR